MTRERTDVTNVTTQDGVNNINMPMLIRDVLEKAASGRVRQHFFHNQHNEFSETIDDVVCTLNELAYAGRKDVAIETDGTNTRSNVKAQYFVSSYEVPSNIGLYDVLNLGQFYTSQKMLDRNRPIGTLKSNYDRPVTGKILSPSELLDAYRLMEITANNGWKFASLTKPQLTIASLSHLRGEDAHGFFIVEGEGSHISPEVLLATGLTFEDTEFRVKTFYPDEYSYNGDYNILRNKLAVDTVMPGSGAERPTTVVKPEEGDTINNPDGGTK